MSCKRGDAERTSATAASRSRISAPRKKAVTSPLAAGGTFLLAIVLAGGLLGCSTTGTGSTSTSASSSSTGSDTDPLQVAAVALDTDDLFSEEDLDASYDTASAETITLADGASTSSSSSVAVSGDIVTITQAGTYLVSGSLSQGSLVVEVGDDDVVRIVLDEVSISSETSAALLVRNADTTIVTLASGSKNTLVTSGTYDESDEDGVDAALFSKDDLTINGSGSLVVSSAEGHGILSKDDLAIVSGTYQVTAAKRALSGNDSIRILDGSFDLTSGTDAIHSENNDDETRGYVCIEGGSFTITTEGDGISASSTTQIDGGSFTITTGEGAGEVVTSEGEAWPGGSMGAAGGMGSTALSTETSTEDDGASQKGVKADSDLLVRGGTFTIDSSDDAFHANGNVLVSGGTITIATGDDAIHADAQAAVTGGTITVTQSYEGIEGQAVLITDGTISLVSSDDGLNAAGGNDESGLAEGSFGGDSFASDMTCSITITGGSLTIDADGDGIDSNGSLTISGGETIVYGPSSGEDGALDCDGTATISGGVVVAFGSSFMAENFSSSGTQASALVTASINAGSEIVLTDANGLELLRATSTKSATSVVVSCPDMEENGTYTLSVDGSATEFTLNGLTYGGVNGMGDAGVGGGGMGGDAGVGGNMPEGGMGGEQNPGGNTGGNAGAGGASL